MWLFQRQQKKKIYIYPHNYNDISAIEMNEIEKQNVPKIPIKKPKPTFSWNQFRTFMIGISKKKINLEKFREWT